MHRNPLSRGLTLSLAMTLGLSASLAPPQATAQEKSFLWRVQSQESSVPVFLLGSIHVANEEIYPLAPAIEKAFASCDTLAVEVDVTDLDAEESQYILSKAFYPTGESLDQHLSEESRAKLENTLKRYNVQLAQVQQMKPWFLANMILQSELSRQGMKPELGIDQHFLRKAHDQGMQILELESVQQQVALFETILSENEDLLLTYMLEELDVLEAQMKQMFDAWKNGDVQALQEFLKEPAEKNPEFKPIVDELFGKRNVGMANRVQEFLSTQQSVFVIVGAGHLIGDGGVVDLLQEKGFSVERL